SWFGGCLKKHYPNNNVRVKSREKYCWKFSEMNPRARCGPRVPSWSEPALPSDQCLLQYLFQGVADAIDLTGGHLPEERQGQRAGGDVLADGEVAAPGAELLGDVGLEVDGRE